MGNRKLQHRWKHLSKASLLILAVLWLLVGLSAVLSLRQNNLTMLHHREAVFEADKTGVDLEKRLSELQDFVSRHMNARLPKLGDEKAIQLKSTYDRLVAAEEARVSAERVRVTNEATAYCEANLASVALTVRAKCVQDYVAARPVSTRSIPKELYTFDFVSPSWSPDLAGWLTVIFFLLTALLALRLCVGLLVRLALRDSI